MPPRAKKRAKAGYMISAVAELYKLHPQTLRLYERVGLLKPSRSQGNTRLYTDSDLERLGMEPAERDDTPARSGNHVHAGTDMGRYDRSLLGHERRPPWAASIARTASRSPAVAGRIAGESRRGRAGGMLR